MTYMNKPQIAGNITAILNQKNHRSWYGLKNVNGRWISQNRKKASMPALVIPTEAGIVLGMSV